MWYARSHSETVQFIKTITLTVKAEPKLLLHRYLPFQTVTLMMLSLESWRNFNSESYCIIVSVMLPLTHHLLGTVWLEIHEIAPRNSLSITLKLAVN